MTFQTVLVLLAGFALYVMHSAYRPYARCWLCKGSPRVSSNSGRTWRNCVKCKGKGMRVRIGRRVFEKLNPKATRK